MRGGKRKNSGRKKVENPKKFKTFSVLETDFLLFSQIAKEKGLSNNALFSLFLYSFVDVLKKNLDKSKKFM
jgi:hypothetical protein